MQTLPDLILLDIMMPGMSGYEVCSRLRARYPSSLLPIIMVSAKGEEEDVVQVSRRRAFTLLLAAWLGLDGIGRHGGTQPGLAYRHWKCLQANAHPQHQGQAQRGPLR